MRGALCGHACILYFHAGMRQHPPRRWVALVENEGTESGVRGAAAPVATGLTEAPSPVKYNVMMLPTAAGLSAPFNDRSWFWATARFCPNTKMPIKIIATFHCPSRAASRSLPRAGPKPHLESPIGRGKGVAARTGPSASEHCAVDNCTPGRLHEVIMWAIDGFTCAHPGCGRQPRISGHAAKDAP